MAMRTKALAAPILCTTKPKVTEGSNWTHDSSHVLGIDNGKKRLLTQPRFNPERTLVGPIAFWQNDILERKRS